MELRTLGRTGYQVSIIAFGGIVVKGMEAKEAAEIVAEGVARGINYFDVAPSYGDAQYVLGPALEPHRKGVYLACKTGKRDAAGADAELRESLKALKTDHFDVYQLHGLDDPEEIEQVFSPGGAMEVLLEAKKSGVARHIGFTCHHDASALEILRRGDGAFSTTLFPVNFAYKAQKQGSLSAIRACVEREMGIIAIKALAHRKWRDGEEKTHPNCWYKPICDDDALARLALNDTLSQPITTAVPPGDKRMLRLALDIIEAQHGASARLTKVESEALGRVAESVSEVIF